jgi:hypothetical protein
MTHVAILGARSHSIRVAWHVLAPIRRAGLAAAMWSLTLLAGCADSRDSSVEGTQGGGRLALAEDLEGRPRDPLAESAGKVTVLTFVRTDCPISNRYAPTLRTLCREFTARGAEFYLVYPDSAATAEEIQAHLEEYGWGMAAVRDPQHALVRRAGATITPEAAVFDARGKLVYHGRIDDRHVDFGQARPAPTTHDLRDAIVAALDGTRVETPVTEAVGCFIADLE